MSPWRAQKRISAMSLEQFLSRRERREAYLNGGDLFHSFFYFVSASNGNSSLFQLNENCNTLGD